MLPALISSGAGLIGGLVNNLFGDSAGDKNAQQQLSFARNSIRWRVEDAKRAGVHPLYALGAPTMSPSPSYVGDTSLGSSIASMGADVSRAMEVGNSSAGRLTNQLSQLALTRAGLENELLRSQIARTNRELGPPGVQGANPLLGTVLQGSDGKPIMTVHGPTPAQTAENQYGEVGGELFGISNLIYDIGRQIGRDWGTTYPKLKARFAPAPAYSPRGAYRR